MKIRILIMFLLGVWILTSCDTPIHPNLQSADPVYVIDAFVNNKLDTQVIKISYSQPYFEEQLPPPVSGATVKIYDPAGVAVVFTENPNEKGSYIWLPGTIQGLGKEGIAYTLVVNVNGESFISSEEVMGRVPKIDSITFKLNDDRPGQSKKMYFAQFWAVDPLGVGDTYWIRAYKNKILLNKPSEINLAYDAAFSKGSSFDGFTFIQPIRNGINPNDTDSNDQPISPYNFGDSVYVEIHSLTEASFDYLNQVVTETNRPGGFSELFARPLANVSTNIFNADPKGTKAVGFFNVASVSALGKKFATLN